MGVHAGRSMIVTGGAGAIGYATARILAREGARVMLVDIDEERLRGCEDELRASGADVTAVRADCADEADTRAYVAAAIERYGSIDGFFHNAGVEGDIAQVQDYAVEEFDRIIRVNLRGMFLGLKIVLAEMVKAKAGAVVLTASIGSERGLRGGGPYNASKHGVLGLTRTAASEVGPLGIRVNCVEPGVIVTPLLNVVLEQMFDGDIDAGLKNFGKVASLARCGQPAEVGEVVSFLLSDAASFVNGAAWAVDGGALATILH